MKQHPFYTEALTALATMHQTLPAMLLESIADADADGRRHAEQLRVLCNFAAVMYQQGRDSRDGALERVADSLEAARKAIGSHWPSAPQLSDKTGSTYGAVRGIQPPSLDIKPRP